MAGRKTAVLYQYNLLKKLDMFGYPLPQFNKDGETKVSTGWGALVSIAVIVTTFLFADLKFRQLVEGRNPQITTVVHSDGLEMGESFDTSGDDFMMAFAFIDFKEGSLPRSLSSPN